MPLIVVAAAREITSGLFVENVVLVGRLVQAHGDNRQASGILLLTFPTRAVVVPLRAFGVKLTSAGHAPCHLDKRQRRSAA